MVHGKIVPAGGSVSSTKNSICGTLSEKVHIGVEIRGQSGAPVHFGGGDCCDCLALSLLALFFFHIWFNHRFVIVIDSDFWAIIV